LTEFEKLLLKQLHLALRLVDLLLSRGQSR
jgi:hypothetical protein